MPDDCSPSVVLPPERLKALRAAVAADAAAGRDESPGPGCRSCCRRSHGRRRRPGTSCPSWRRDFSPLEVLAAIHDAHGRDEDTLAMIGRLLDRARNIELLNDRPPVPPLFATVVEALTGLAAGRTDTGLLEGLATAAKTLARQNDAVAERAHRQLVELEPGVGHHHYNLGLFLKTRGRFREGMRANQAAAGLAAEPDEATQWNLGICATGAGEGEVALAVWKEQQQVIGPGRFGLPEGGYAMVKVRLAERPLAERSAQTDDPGLEETIWIERLSPCHGIVRSVLHHDLGVDHGDVVLFDGAPITFHRYGEQQIPVFPHLATLVRSGYQLFNFTGVQRQTRQLADASRELARDAVIYSHTESVVMLCALCWRDEAGDHSHQETGQQLISGQIAAPPDMDPGELLRQLDAAIALREGCHLYVPGLCRLAGLPERAAAEERRLEMILQARH